MSDVTRILDQLRQGDPRAANELLPLVYDELRKLAAQRLAQEKSGQTLQATALVHEAFLRLVSPTESRSLPGEVPWDGKAHFFAAAAEAMRRILVENARRKRRRKHGGGMQRKELHSNLAAAPTPDEELIALDAALAKLVQRYPLHGRLVELRYFGGLSGDDAALSLQISPSTADRHWRFARAWLRRELGGREIQEDF
ncbi:MAG TPA: ECF-type sigma factor [Pirellulales bacterium]|jgi:RNA polymerase sigma factor (TIGR02999 family)|nr:ECF-type sigma factor [Pirellulales bacterium]